MKRLQVPTLSQGNSTHDRFYRNPRKARRDGVVLGLYRNSTVWYGRTSASMIYNYFKQVQQHVPNEAMANVLEVENAGVWGERGATYWLKATRLFEANQHSPDETDLWGDYATKEGLTVWIHDTLVTPRFPVRPRDQAAGGVSGRPRQRDRGDGGDDRVGVLGNRADQ